VIDEFVLKADKVANGRRHGTEGDSSERRPAWADESCTIDNGAHCEDVCI
jgi:hypothetical protein